MMLSFSVFIMFMYVVYSNYNVFTMWVMCIASKYSMRYSVKEV